MVIHIQPFQGFLEGFVRFWRSLFSKITCDNDSFNPIVTTISL